jgi:hypothetical protein
MAYARAGWHWTWRRFTTSEAATIIALGSIATQGLLRLLARQGLSLRVPRRPDIGAAAIGRLLTSEPAVAKLPTQLACEWWEASAKLESGDPRRWRILPVHHPSWRNVHDPRYERAIGAFRAMTGAELPEAGLASDGAWTGSQLATPTRRSTHGSSTTEAVDHWSRILRGGRTPRVGLLLASHADATRLTARLVEGLTVARLVAIADALHNQCRVGVIEAMAPADPTRHAEIAWRALLEGANKVYRQPTSWTGAIRLLEDGKDEGLAAVSALDIGAITRLCAWIVSGPYDDANRRGVR